MKIEITETYRKYSAFIATIPQLVSEGRGEAIYRSRNEVWRLEHDGRVFVVKKYKRANPIQRVAYTFFRPSKAKRAYRFAEEFRNRGVRTPREIAYIEESQWGLFTTGYFVSEEVKGRETHLDLREVEVFDPSFADAVVRQVVFMHSRGILHGDLNLTNFIYERQADGEYIFTLIDLNRSHFTEGWPTDRQSLQNMVRLTHRKDLYEYLVRRYAELRGWNADEIAAEALRLLHRFEHRRLK